MRSGVANGVEVVEPLGEYGEAEELRRDRATETHHARFKDRRSDVNEGDWGAAELFHHFPGVFDMPCCWRNHMNVEAGKAPEFDGRADPVQQLMTLRIEEKADLLSLATADTDLVTGIISEPISVPLVGCATFEGTDHNCGCACESVGAGRVFERGGYGR